MLNHSSTAAILLRPLPLAALVLLAFNDHVLKGSGHLPGAITGKLSDLAGLAYFPLVLFVCLRSSERFLRRVFGLAAHREGSDRRLLDWACALTAAVFSASKLSPAAADLVVAAADLLLPGPDRARVVTDPTDLATVPAVLLARQHARRVLDDSAAYGTHPADQGQLPI